MARILLVDDDATVRQLVCRMLERAGYDVLEVEDGLIAYNVIRELDGAFDLLITDIVMPRMTGTELVERVRAEYPKLKTLCMSGYTQPRALKGHSFLAKPFTATALLSIVQKTMGVSPTEEPHAREIDERLAEWNLRAQLVRARAKLKITGEECERLTAIWADVAGTPDGRQALQQAAAVKDNALTEYSEALQKWTEFAVNRKR